MCPRSDELNMLLQLSYRFKQLNNWKIVPNILLRIRCDELKTPLQLSYRFKLLNNWKAVHSSMSHRSNELRYVFPVIKPYLVHPLRDESCRGFRIYSRQIMCFVTMERSYCKQHRVEFKSLVSNVPLILVPLLKYHPANLDNYFYFLHYFLLWRTLKLVVKVSFKFCFATIVVYKFNFLVSLLTILYALT